MKLKFAIVFLVLSSTITVIYNRYNDDNDELIIVN